MKKVALVFVIAVFVPSLVLAWLAVRSLRDQQTLLERQQAALFQTVTDSVAREINDYLAAQQQQFDALVETLVTNQFPRDAAASFDDRLRAAWPVAEVGFCVTLAGNLLCPSPSARVETQLFCRDNSSFLGNQEVAEVYRNTFNVSQSANNSAPQAQWNGNPNPIVVLNNGQVGNDTANGLPSSSNFVNYGKAQNRKVSPAQQLEPNWAQKAVMNNDENVSKVIPSEAQFRQLIGDEPNGMLARFLQDKLRVLFWHRLERDPQLVFGVQLSQEQIVAGIRAMVQSRSSFGSRPDLRPNRSVNILANDFLAKTPIVELPDEMSLVVLDENAKPVAFSDQMLEMLRSPDSVRLRTTPSALESRFRDLFKTDIKHPFVASEIGEALPHWEVAAYLRNPDGLKQAARTIQLTLGLLITVLVAAIGMGSWLIVRDLNRQLTLARQKTDFVSNVSHELKTPLTSIRMFAELLAEGRVNEPAKQRNYLNIITAEASRLTRLINNVLDFSRIERGQKKYNMAECDLVAITSEAAATLRPHLETAGFRFETALSGSPITIQADRDAVSQVIVNLLSNAEKYSNGGKEIRLEVERTGESIAELRVLDRGPGVTHECREKIFEQFYRVNDSLTNAVPGSGLGLTLARQIARAHGGDVTYAARDAGGSCFTLRLPINQTVTTNEN